MTPVRLAEHTRQLTATALVVVVDDALRYRHELAREIVEGELTPGERTELHAGWAAALERLRPSKLGDVARHWAAADRPTEALGAATAAARAAMGSGAPAEAETHLLRALALWGDVDDPATVAGSDYVALLIDTSVAARHAHHADLAVSLALQAVSELDGGEAMREGVAWLQLREVYRDRRQWADCADAVDRALAVIPQHPPSAELAEALADASRNHFYAGRGQQAVELAERAVAVAEAAGDRSALVLARTALAGGSELLGVATDLAYSEETLALCDRDTPPETTIYALNGVAHVCSRLGRNADLLAVAERGVGIARTHGLAGFCAATMAQYCVACNAEMGRWERAEALVAELGDLLDDPTDADVLARAWGLVLLRQGRLEEARRLIEGGRVIVDSGGSEDAAWVASAIVQFDAAEGRFADAAARVERILSTLTTADEAMAELVAVGVAVLADGVRALDGRADRRGAGAVAAAVARRWLACLEADPAAIWRRDVVGALRVVEARAHLARLEGDEDAALWPPIADRWAELCFPWEEAEARLRRGEALLAGTAGRTVAARHRATEELARARSAAAALGARPLLEAIDGLIRRARLAIDAVPAATPFPGSGTNGCGLTPREQDVMSLLAEGRSNGEIAAALYLSTKTASVHVSNILRKLGVANRVEAVAVAGAPHPTSGDRGSRSIVEWLGEAHRR